MLKMRKKTSKNTARLWNNLNETKEWKNNQTVKILQQ